MVLDKQTDEIRRIYNAYQGSGTPDRIRSAFSQIGIKAKTNDYIATVNISNARAVSGIERQPNEPDNESDSFNSTISITYS